MVSVRSGNTSSNIVQATNSMAEHYAELAEGYKDDAATYAQASLLQAALAQQWAIKMDGAVDGVEYSAKYYANLASSAVAPLEPIIDDLTNIETLVADLPNVDTIVSNLSDVTAVATNISDISAVAADLTNIDNASSYAQLAEDWATKTNGTVDGTDYSAKYYAQSISTALSNYTPTANLADVALSGAYSDLTGTPTIPAAQIQSDWTQSDNTKLDYIKNKPTIPTVNNATLTIQKNGTNVQTFTANASSNVTCNITVPTNTNELTNGAGFITSSAISNMQTTTNLVTSVSSSSTNSQYPSAKLFYDTVGDIESAINTIRGI